MANSPHDIREAVSIHIAAVHQDSCRSELKFLVKWPCAGTRIGRLLVPALGRDDIEPLVSIDIADSHAMSCPLLAQFVLCPDDFRAASCEFVPDDVAHAVRQEIR